MKLKAIERYRQMERAGQRTVACEPMHAWNSIVATIEENFRKNNSREGVLQDQLFKMSKERMTSETEKNKLFAENTELKKQMKIMENKIEEDNIVILSLRDEIMKLQSKVEKLKTDKVFNRRPEERDKEDQKNNDSLKSMHNVTVKVDDKLERLHSLISELTKNSRIMIDSSNNIITDHPFVESDMFEVRDDINRLNKMGEEKGQPSNRYNNSALNNLNLKPIGVPNANMLGAYKKKKSTIMGTQEKLMKRKTLQIPDSSPRASAANLNSHPHAIIRTDSLADDQSSGRMSQVRSRDFDDTPKYSNMVPSKRLINFPAPSHSATMKAKYTQTDSFGLETFLVLEEPIKQKMIRKILSFTMDPESLTHILDILESFGDQEINTKKNIYFVKNLLENQYLNLLQDATSNGENIQKELVIYIKKIQNADMQGNKVQIAEQMLDKNRMTKDDSMATQNFKKKKSYMMGGSGKPGGPLATSESPIGETGKTEVEVRAALKDYEVNPELQAMREEYISSLKRDKPQRMNIKYEDRLKKVHANRKLKSLEKIKPSTSIGSKLELVESQLNADEETIRKLYEHLSQNRQFFRRYYKYPFKSVEQIDSELSKKDHSVVPDAQIGGFSLIGEAELMSITNFDNFRERFIEVVKIHKACGDICPHLRRFYERLGFDPSAPSNYIQRNLPKLVIDKIVMGDFENLIEPACIPKLENATNVV